jgi:esterase/lipase
LSVVLHNYNNSMIKPTFTCKTYPAKDARRVIFFFAGFGGKTWHYKPAYSVLNKMGYNVVAYHFPGRPLLNVDMAFLEALGKRMSTDVRHQIANYKSQGITEFASFGISMGSTYSISIAKHVPEIKRMVFITCYGSSAQEVWEYAGLKKMKQIYTDQGMSTTDVENAHPWIENTKNMQLLADKTMLLYASRADKVILYANTKRFIDMAEQKGLHLETIIGNGRHQPFIASSLFRGRRWRAFLT